MQALQAKLAAHIQCRHALDEASKARKLVDEAEKAAMSWELKYKVINKKAKEDQMKVMRKEFEEIKAKLTIQATEL